MPLVLFVNSCYSLHWSPCRRLWSLCQDAQLNLPALLPLLLSHRCHQQSGDRWLFCLQCWQCLHDLLKDGFVIVAMFSSIQSFDWLGLRGDMKDNSAETLFLSFLQEALASNSGISRDVHSLMLPIQHFFCWPQHRPSSKMPWRMVLERLSWHVTCQNHASFRLLTVAGRGSCEPTRKLILVRSHLTQRKVSKRLITVGLMPGVTPGSVLYFRSHYSPLTELIFITQHNVTVAFQNKILLFLKSLCKTFSTSYKNITAGSPSLGGDVMVYVLLLDINQPSLPTLFILFMCLFPSLWPLQLYFIP